MQYKFILILISLFNIIFPQEVIGPGLFGSELFNYLKNNYQTNTTLGYNNARDVMYSTIDIKSGNQLSGVYSGYTITLDLSQDPSTDAYNKGINCEHTWPQSLGASSEPMKSDMHHLFPTKSNVNSSRGNDPFDEVVDALTDKWYRNDYYIESIPTEFINEYAEKYNPPNQSDERFEPREEQKGNTARAMLYFYTIYNTNPNVDLSFWDLQESTILDWHHYDLPDETEITRSNLIASHQGNQNPYVVDPSLAGRIFYAPNNSTLGDVNQDGGVDVIDVVMNISHILGQNILDESLVIVSDINYDLSLDVLDVVMLVQIILN